MSWQQRPAGIWLATSPLGIVVILSILKMALENMWIVFISLLVIVTAVERKDSPNHRQRVNDQAAILAGVGRVVSSQRSGYICVFQEKSFPILHTVHDGTLMPTAAGGRYGDGRVVSFSHDAALDEEPDSARVSDRKRLFDNIFSWVSDGKFESVLFIWGCHRRPETQKHIGERFKRASNEAINTHRTTINSDLTNYNVVVLLGEFTEGPLEKLREFVDKGGGLVMASTNWWYGHLYNGKFREWPPRKLQTLADHAWRANPYYHQYGKGPYYSLSALGQFTGGCEEGTERPVSGRTGKKKK